MGRGDSVVAGFIQRLLNGCSTQEALDFASGIGAFVATQAGVCPQYEISQITELINSNPHKKIQAIL